MLGIINVNIVTSILNAMHKEKAMVLGQKNSVLCWNHMHAMHCFNVYRHLDCINVIGAGLFRWQSFLPVMHGLVFVQA